MSALLALVAVVSGLHGVVMRGPTTPVCRIGTPCSEPAAGAVLVFSRNGVVAARVRVGADGRYTVRLRRGLYAVSLPSAPRIGRGLSPAQARVRGGVLGRLDFEIDTGIR
jgi:hypothetical protein